MQKQTEFVPHSATIVKNVYFCKSLIARMERLNTPYGLSQHLFWDIDAQNFDMDKNAAWIIQRVLEYGNMKDWMIIEDHFGIDKIIAYGLNFRTLDPVALSFLCFISGVDKKKFRCYHFAQSNPTPWNS